MRRDVIASNVTRCDNASHANGLQQTATDCNRLLARCVAMSLQAMSQDVSLAMSQSVIMRHTLTDCSRLQQTATDCNTRDVTVSDDAVSENVMSQDVSPAMSQSVIVPER